MFSSSCEKLCSYVPFWKEIHSRSTDFLTCFKLLSFRVAICRLSSASMGFGFAIHLYCSKESDTGMGQISYVGGYVH